MKRDPDTNKYNYGHALLIAGSYGKGGAALLAARACMRAGVGLLTVHLPRRCVELMQIGCPEAMVSVDADDSIFTTLPQHLERYSTIAVGPGLGTDLRTCDAFRALLLQLRALPQPPRLLLDADALNIVSRSRDELFPLLPHGTALTPHAAEFDRLFGPFGSDAERRAEQPALAQRYGLNLLLKGHRTTVFNPDGQHHTNTTGNPGMATAGSGDVLTGIVLGIMAQGVEPYEALCIGARIHGKSGDLAVKKQTESSLIASDIIENLKYIDW